MNLLPNGVRSFLTRIHRRLVSSSVGARVLGYHGGKEDVQDYWRSPRDDWNSPQRYLSELASRQFIVDVVRRHAEPNWSILEIGCNAGANLAHLFRAGFTKLGGIEINADAVRLLKQTFPELATHAEIYNASVEEVIRTIPDGAFNIVFTMAVLEHIHKDSEWTFREMARVAKDYFITVEDEKSSGWGHFRRNYQKIFERLGFEQVELLNCRDIEGLGPGFFARVFAKKSEGAGR